MIRDLDTVGQESTEARATSRAAGHLSGFAGLVLALLLVLLPAVDGAAVALPAAFGAGLVDRDGNDREDALDSWLAGELNWQDLRARARSLDPALADLPAPPSAGPADQAFQPGPWQRGNLRLLCLGAASAPLTEARELAAQMGVCRSLVALERFGGVTALEVDPDGLRTFLAAAPPGRYLLDRSGRPALVDGRQLIGAEALRAGSRELAGDWAHTVAIIDSGCDTAHDDLGDFTSDNIDGPPPEVGHAFDWFDAAGGWPVYQAYRVVGWHDVTDDFPLAQGPWDYHYHGTALAGVVAASGTVEPTLSGVAQRARLTVVKFYDFDGIWHQWASDFLAACDWVLDNHEMYRIAVVLAAVNFDVDAGISAAMTALLDAGILPVVAMGNHGDDPGLAGFPARSTDALSVGAVNDDAQLAGFSGRGPEGSGKPDLVAPGGGVLSTAGRITTTDNDPNDTYSERQGTSLAAAHVAGAANLLLAAMRQDGMRLPTDRSEALLIATALTRTAAPVMAAESADGTTQYALPLAAVQDEQRGWGMLRVDAAVAALLDPLPVGRAAQDTLLSATALPTVARRLVLPAQGRFVVSADPSPGLDVELTVFNTSWSTTQAGPWLVLRSDDAGGGGTESVEFAAGATGADVVVVRRLAGSGTVLIEATAADPEEASARVILTGRLTGWVNTGRLAGQTDPSVIVTSQVEVDATARNIFALDPSGAARPNFPVFVFKPPTLVGDLSAPCVWDLDGTPGDEIIVASDYGTVYFVQSDGSFSSVDLAPNRRLSAPVGVERGDGQRLVVVVDESGIWQSFSANAVLQDEVDLDNNDPRPPVVGQLLPDATEETAVVFADGSAHAVNAAGNPLPGWPVALGSGEVLAPVLWDRDHDGLHELVVPIRLAASGELILRVLNGDGSPADGDGTVMAAPLGGQWLLLSDPALAGSYDTGDLRLVLAGLADNGGSGDALRWSLARGDFPLSGGAQSAEFAGMRIRVTTSPAYLDLRWQLMATPISYNHTGGSGADPEYPLALAWREVTSGIPDWFGACSGRFQGTAGDLLSDYAPFAPGGPAAESPAALCSAVDDLASGRRIRVTGWNDQILVETVRRLPGDQPLWASPRADGRNSGAFPLPSPATPVANPRAGAPWLGSWPNPGSGPFRISWRNVVAGEARLTVYDLRGRRLQRLALETATTGSLVWDGRDDGGRSVAAGTYFFVLEHAGGSLTGRVVVAR